MIQAVEDHRFDPVEAVSWRNRLLDFSSTQGLLRCLEMRPPKRYLMRPRDADDHVALAELARDEGVTDRATNPAAVRLLWEVCQIPDFRKVMPDHHAALLRQVYLHLMAEDGLLPEDWIAGHINRLDDTTGDIDTLTMRLAHIRTWTYIGHRGDWLADSRHWRERGRAIEDRLSDALHERLMQRFVDQRHALLGRRRHGGGEILAAVTAKGDVVVEGHSIGTMAGLSFKPLNPTRDDGDRAFLAAARPALLSEAARRVGELVGAPDGEFHLGDDGSIEWRKAPAARLAGGDDLLRPRVLVSRNELIDGAQGERMRGRLAVWLEHELRRRMKPLYRLLDAELGSMVRGLAFQLAEGLGTMPRRAAVAQINALTRADRQALGRYGVRIGLETVYLTALLKLPTLRLRAILWAARQGGPVPLLPGKGDETMAATDAPADFWAAVGYRVLGTRAIRADRLEALARTLRKLAAQGEFTATAELRALAGCEGAAFESVLSALGYRARQGEDGISFRKPARKAKPNTRRGKRKPKANEDSPFADLKKLVLRK
ncbi:MAG: hypothetical protein IMF05_16080 [Proteobacteria bacterium]|nr:hypothetical protein [Pseudomonadota bacterium]